MELAARGDPVVFVLYTVSTVLRISGLSYFEHRAFRNSTLLVHFSQVCTPLQQQVSSLFSLRDFSFQNVYKP